MDVLAASLTAGLGDDAEARTAQARLKLVPRLEKS